MVERRNLTDVYFDPETSEWWAKHKEMDRKRKEAERQRKADTIREFKRKLAKAEKELKELE
jgi:hypothetical protein